ncbi:MAG: hypothetical protein AAF725_14925 [Acidobacteriota bacterium]
MSDAADPHAAAFGETYLRVPDLFPARQAGEAWGARELTVDFVGGPYRFTGLSAGQAKQLRGRFEQMVAENLPATVSVAVMRVAASEFKPIELDGWSYTFDRNYLPRSVEVAGLDFMGRVDFEPTLSAALWTPLGDGPFFLSQAENFFRLLVAYRLLALGGVLFHSAAVVSRRVAYLFLGHSGAGKSTISRLSLASGREVLSDDMNALCPVDGLPHIEKLPFAGDLGNRPGPRQSFPLAAVCRLRQGEHGVRPMTTAEAVAFLIGCAPFVNVDPHRAERLTDNLLNLVRGFPMRELTFAKDPGFWPLIEENPGENR